MNVQDLIAFLQIDLKNERKHLLFYIHSAAMVHGPLREEYKEFFLKEAASELKHVEEFSNMIIYLGAVPDPAVNEWSFGLRSPYDILDYAYAMEQEVANNYTQRLNATQSYDTATEATIHLFYENQLLDSQQAAWEINQMRSRCQP